MPGIRGKFPDLLTDPVVGEAASNLYADARRVLKQMVAERWSVPAP
jgi:5-methyltetrahydrofolate--homocysteine methyltransferase